MCACSMKNALAHQPVELGQTTGGDEKRVAAMRSIIQEFSYKPVSGAIQAKEQAAYVFHKPGAGPFTLTGSPFQECLFWV